MEINGHYTECLYIKALHCNQEGMNIGVNGRTIGVQSRTEWRDII